jgi:hypothetical protein
MFRHGLSHDAKPYETNDFSAHLYLVSKEAIRPGRTTLVKAATGYSYNRVMKQAHSLAAVGVVVCGLLAAPLTVKGAERRGSVSGEYVEARTAEVFTGGCIMNSEAETVGRQAVLAWKVDRGSFNGISLDGLSVVAALAADRNLGMTEMGGAKPAVRSAIFVDDRANPAQQIALVAMANELSKGLVGTIVQVTPTPVQFTNRGGEIEVTASQVRLDVSKHVVHEPTCGAMQWFHPFSSVDAASIGLAAEHAFTGSALGTKWSDPNKRSAFFGTFTY